MPNNTEGQLVDMWNKEEESTGLKGWMEENVSKKGAERLVSNIKESLDLVNRKYKINNLSFSLNNFYYEGTRFSDFVSDRALLNKTVEVYYKTQSCKTLDDCVLLFRGDIRKFTHDSKVVKIELEDLTEGNLSKKLPIANTGFGGNLYNKEHKNQPIPMVYGSVEKAPAIPFIDIQAQNDETDIDITKKKKPTSTHTSNLWSNIKNSSIYKLLENEKLLGTELGHESLIELIHLAQNYGIMKKGGRVK